MATAIGRKEYLPDTTCKSQAATKTRKRPLEPINRLSEIWFGLTMVLTFTCSLSVHQAGHQEVRTMLIAAIGCNVAWGLIDGFMYLLACFVEQGHDIFALRAVRMASDPAVARGIIANAMPPLLASALSPAEFENVHRRLNELPEPPVRPYLSKEDWLGSASVFLAVFLSTFPVVIPFLLTKSAPLALRISNGIAIAMLFVTGYEFGRYAGHRPWRMGLCMAVVGSALVFITIRLGG